ncbi:MAG: Fic family protein [Pseudomonadota bacterium]
MNSAAGRFERLQIDGEDQETLAFVPLPLPPRNPKVSRPGELSERLNAAEHALARLAFAGRMLPDPEPLLHAFARREAVLSSRLDGLQVELMDFLRSEVMDDTAGTPALAQLHNHIAAWRQARDQLAGKKESKLSLALLDRAWQEVFRDSDRPAGKAAPLRHSQEWGDYGISGQSSYLPPAAHRLPVLLEELEAYLQSGDKLPELVRIGLIQAQFESIHPYPAGNGRLARLLSTLLLEHWGYLELPLPCLSLHFHRQGDNYAQRLAAIREEGDWEGWTGFFLDSLEAAADEAVATLRDLHAIVTRDRKRLLASEGSALSAARLFEDLPGQPVLTVARTMELLQTTKPTAGRAIEALVDAGILEEITGRKRDRSYVYTAFIDRLARGMEREQE